jgi:hypothetical protein
MALDQNGYSKRTSALLLPVLNQSFTNGSSADILHFQFVSVFNLRHAARRRFVPIAVVSLTVVVSVGPRQNVDGLHEA